MFPLLVKAGLTLGTVVLGALTANLLVFHHGILTPDRKKVFDVAMRESTDPVKLRALAAQFDKWGLRDQASQLRARAAMLEAPPSVQQQRQAAANQAANTIDPSKAAQVQNVANAFAASGDPTTAEALTLHAQQLAQTVTPPIPPMPVSPSPVTLPSLPTQSQGAPPPVHPGTALGDNLGAVKTVTGEQPRGGDAFQERVS